MFVSYKTQKDFGIDPFTCPQRRNIWIKCDYCGNELIKEKKTVIKLRKNIEKDTCGNSSCINKKRTEINNLLYGCDNPFKNKEVQTKIRKTNLKKYGCEQFVFSKEFKNKRQEALLKNLGVSSPMQNEAVKNKQQKTCKEKFGVDNFAKTDEFLEKYKRTSRKKFGTDSPMQTKEVQKKKSDTSLRKYGVKNYTQTKQYWDQRIKTCKEKYGVDHPSQHPKIVEKTKKTNLERYGVDNYAKTQECKEKMRDYFWNTIGVPNPLCLAKNRKYGKTQEEIADWLDSLGVNCKSNYTILNGKEIDLYNEQNKVAIEYCGLFWHTEMSPQPRDKNYHYFKYKACSGQNIRLITMFEDEWKNRNKQCKNFLKSVFNIVDKTVYARKCEVKMISKKESDAFCEEHHIQGPSMHTQVSYGLFHHNVMIGIMSLGRHPRKSNSIVLDRLCFADGWQIIGGASKLFSQCTKWAKANKVSSIISWSDNRWSQGMIYQKLGFRLDEDMKPDYSYVNIKKPYRRLSKQSQKKSVTKCPLGMTEFEWATQHGLARIWDCGKKRWVFKVSAE